MIRFCPDLTLGTHIVTIVPEESSSDEEDDLDLVKPKPTKEGGRSFRFTQVV